MGQRRTEASPVGRALGRGVTEAAAEEGAGAGEGRPLHTHTAEGAAHRSSSDICSSSSSSTVCCRGLLRPLGLAYRLQAQQEQEQRHQAGGWAGRGLGPPSPRVTAEGRGGGRCSTRGGSARIGSRGSASLQGGVLARPSPAAAGRRGGRGVAERAWPQRACVTERTRRGRERGRGRPAGLPTTPTRLRGSGSVAPRPQGCLLAVEASPPALAPPCHAPLTAG
jgi:hypothetical protein